MRKNTKLVDAIFAELMPIFELQIPFYWDSMRGSDFAEWSNVDIEDMEFHRIRINFKMHENAEMLRETIAHELIHAWQHENGYDVDHSGVFAKWCAWFRKEHNLNTASSECDAFEIFSEYCKLMKEVA